MRIISNFKDYYDVMLQYGADQTIIFPRINHHLYGEQTLSFENNDWKIGHTENELKDSNLLKRISEGNIINLEEKSSNSFQILKNYFRNIDSDKQYPRAQLKKVIAVINGKPSSSYIIIEHSEHNIKYKIIKKNVTEEDCFNYLKEKKIFLSSLYYNNVLGKYKDYKEFEEANNKNKSSYYHRVKINYQFEITEKDLLDIHKEINSPIYYIVDNKVLSNIPLVYFGITKLFDDNVAILYQEIAYCLNNVVNNKNEPPSTISNEMKIEQHGFDKKISFRKRI